MYVRPGDEGALKYLRSVAADDGGIPSFAPFDIFERVWVLWNLLLTEEIKNPEIIKLCTPHVDYIEKCWKPQQGLGFSAQYSLTDGDDTSVGQKVLTSFGRNFDIETLHVFEEKDWFRCYHLEVNPSIDVNIHFLGTLSLIGYESSHPSIVKIVNFLRSLQNNEGYWIDKWHVSPYYTTSHAIIACLKFDETMCERAVNWILNTQKPDGSWGFHEFSTAEETAYCIQALHIWRMNGKKVNKNRIMIAKKWLMDHYKLPHPPLWMDKSLYSPEVVVQSVILSALSLAKDY
jgi:halimadienyl-diphosphate synthase